MAELVKNMFRQIAGIDFDADLTDEATVKKLVEEPFAYSKKFNRLSIAFLQDHKGLEPPNGPGISSDLNCVGPNPRTGTPTRA